MTEQSPEILVYRGKRYDLDEFPLEGWFERAGSRPDFDFICTACWRGYVGTWRIVRDRLFLVGIDGTIDFDRPATIAELFPDSPRRKFADWYTGTLYVPHGKVLARGDWDEPDTYERELWFEIVKGIVKRTVLRENPPPG